MAGTVPELGTASRCPAPQGFLGHLIAREFSPEECPPARPRRIFVELVEHDEHKRSRGPLGLLVLHHALQQHADDEHLSGVVERVDIHHGDLVCLPVDPVPRRLAVSQDEMPHVLGSRMQAATERVERASGGVHHLVQSRGIQQVNKVVEGLEPGAQYTPVASIATVSIRQASSQATRRSKSGVSVWNRRTDCVSRSAGTAT